MQSHCFRELVVAVIVGVALVQSSNSISSGNVDSSTLMGSDTGPSPTHVQPYSVTNRFEKTHTLINHGQNLYKSLSTDAVGKRTICGGVTLSRRDFQACLSETAVAGPPVTATLLINGQHSGVSILNGYRVYLAWGSTGAT